MNTEQVQAQILQADAGHHDVVVDEAGTEEETTPVPPHLTTIVLEPSTSAPPSILTEVEHEDSSSSMPTSSSSSVLTHASLHGLSGDGAHVWTQRVSASFSAMADQISAASQAIALIPPLPDTLYNQLSTRLDDIEAAQRKLETDLVALREQIAQINMNDKREQEPVTSSEELLTKLEEHVKVFRLEQQRLPARLHNAIVTVSKKAIKPVVMANGKMPPQFPATRGEFEHLTKERYEALMKAYEIPIAGDTAAKREAVRSFIGLPQ